MMDKYLWGIRLWWGKVGTWGLHCFIFTCPPTLASIIVIIQIVFFFGEPIIQIVSTNLLETFFFFFGERNLLESSTNF